MTSFHQQISSQLNLANRQVTAAIQLLEEGNTIHFIARYRKERTGNLDEVQLRAIQQAYKAIGEMEERRKFILDTIGAQGNLNEVLRKKITAAGSLEELEDIYLPFKVKRKTRADAAKEAGLRPLAELLLKGGTADAEKEALRFLNEKIKTADDALQGAQDIIAQWINENTEVRRSLRILFDKEAFIYSEVYKSKKEEAVKYTDYFNYKERLNACPSHRLLAILRGGKESLLKVKVYPAEERVLHEIERQYPHNKKSSCGRRVSLAISDAYDRLLQPSLENEMISKYKTKADEEAIKVFAENLKQLLLAPPLGAKRIMGIDPGYKTGCKIVCLDEQGNLLHNETIYPHPPQEQKSQASSKVNTLVNTFKTEAIAIGNGTAGRETENFIKKIRFDNDVQVFIVNENGASVYSASTIAREEFPQFDVTVRGAVSIGRRLMDPLAELIKIDPQAIGVGQYQHDVDQSLLKERLHESVASCVNAVGVDLDTASVPLLAYVSGIGEKLAQHIVTYRKEKGNFGNREELKKVTGLGKKAFEQCAGFLRIRDGDNPLDNSAVHPESYAVVKKIAKDQKCSITDLLRDRAWIKGIDMNKYIDAETGAETVKDIIEELAKPGRDVRGKIKVMEFAKGIHTIDQLETGMVLPGIVTNITRFGAFVDIGIKQNGLIHISQMSNDFITDPNQVVKLHEHVQVKVLEVDASRNRIQLTLKDVPGVSNVQKK